MKTVPAVKVALVLAFGLFLGDRVAEINPLAIIAAAAIAILVGWIWIRRSWTNVAAYSTLLCLGFLQGNSAHLFDHSAENLPSEPVLLGGEIGSCAYRSDDRDVLIFHPAWTSNEVSGRKSFAGDLRLIVSPTRRDLELGSRLLLAGQIRAYPEKRNPGGRNLQKELARMHIVGWVKPTRIVSLGSAHASVISGIRASLTETLHDILPARHAGLLTGMLLGDKTEVPDEVRDDFSRSGLYHLLAISGMHIGYLFAILLLVVKPVFLNLRVRRIVLFAILWAYVLITGANPPTVRAALIISLVMLSYELHRTPRRWNLWGGAALLILLVDPQQLFSVGFQLSFAATAGILLAMDFLEEKRSALRTSSLATRRWRRFLGRYVGVPLLISSAAGTFTAPILAAHFGGFALISVVLNLIAIPLAGLIFGLAWAIVASKLILGIAIAPLVAALELGLKALESIAFVGARLPGNSLGEFSGMVTATAIVIAFLGILLSSTWQRRFLWVSGALILLLIAPAIQSQSHLRVESLDVGQGDATLLRFPGGSNLLVDCGGKETAENELLPSLRRQGINRLNALLLTHFDADHAGGALPILEAFRVDRMVVSSLSPRGDLGQKIMNEARRRGIPVRAASLGDTLCGFQNSKCVILWPPESVGGDENRESIVMKVRFGETSILLTGDIEQPEEKFIMNSGGYLQSDILKVAHHGSRNSSQRDFIGKVRPQIGLISCGRGNPYHHPSQRVISDLEAMGCSVYRTDVKHASVFESDGKGIWAVSWQ